MSLRIGFDLDGVLADLTSAYQAVERRLFGPEGVDEHVPDSPPPETGATSTSKAGETGQAGNEAETVGREMARLKAQRHKQAIVWHAIQTTENFWTTLTPISAGAVPRLNDLARRHRWEVFFLTQRPDTGGETVQRQTQRWLADQGFEWPSVIVTRGDRGRLAATLALDYLVDDTPTNCIDVLSDSKATPILVLRHADDTVEANARKLGIAIVSSIDDALDRLDAAPATANKPTLLERLAKRVRWNGRTA